MRRLRKSVISLMGAVLVVGATLVARRPHGIGGGDRGQRPRLSCSLRPPLLERWWAGLLTRRWRRVAGPATR